MKAKILSILSLAALFAVGCSSEEGIPETLEGKKKMLAEKQTELRDLEKKINELSEASVHG